MTNLPFPGVLSGPAYNLRRDITGKKEASSDDDEELYHSRRLGIPPTKEEQQRLQAKQTQRLQQKRLAAEGKAVESQADNDIEPEYSHVYDVKVCSGIWHCTHAVCGIP